MADGDDIPRVFVSSRELSHKLGIADTGVTRLARIGLFERVPHPHKAKAYQYELITSMATYIGLLTERLRAEQEFRRSKRRSDA